MLLILAGSLILVSGDLRIAATHLMRIYMWRCQRSSWRYILQPDEDLQIVPTESTFSTCLPCRPVPPQEYAEWLPTFQAAKTAMQDREAALDAVAELIERELTLLGATAIEDKLQQARH